jgi:hypothetical protein
VEIVASVIAAGPAELAGASFHRARPEAVTINVVMAIRILLCADATGVEESVRSVNLGLFISKTAPVLFRRWARRALRRRLINEHIIFEGANRQSAALVTKSRDAAKWAKIYVIADAPGAN